MPKTLTIITDGACSGNPGHGAWACILASDQHVREMAGYEPATTNNRMELTAVLRGLEAALRSKISLERFKIVLDSAYVADGAQKHLHGWKRRDWKTVAGTDVANRDLWEIMDEVLTKIGPQRIEWKWVRGHNGHPGNERANTLATETSKRGMPPTDLYAGPRAEYPVDLDAPLTSGGGKPFYISVVDGVYMAHETWAECERHVKGKKGAKFKKVHSPAEAEQLKREWKAKP
jgi:ribonuclease HI